jgi:CO/xanthine dehydrogenase Mo-binding subunit
MDDFANVTLITGASEIGQGSETVLSQLVCEELGLPISAVTVVNNDTAITPWDVGVHASRTTFIAGNSAIGAAKKAKGKILAVAAKKYGAAESRPRPARRLRHQNRQRRSPRRTLQAAAQPALPGQGRTGDDDVLLRTAQRAPGQGLQGRRLGGLCLGHTGGRIEVDTDTGFIKLLKVTGAHDVGRVLNRLGIEGQIEGGVVMGQGYAFTEDLMIENGIMKNPNFRDYKLVTAPEIPEMDIAFIESMDGEGPQGAKGVGEAPSICMAAAAANAIANATGVRMFELPFTPEKVYRASTARRRSGTGSRGRRSDGQLPSGQNKRESSPCCQRRLFHGDFRMKRRTVLSMEQALSLPYATLRLRPAWLARDPHRIHAHRRRPARRP